MARTAIIAALLAMTAVACWGDFSNNYPTPEMDDLNYSINVGAALLVNSDMDNSESVAIGVSWFDAADRNFGQMATFGLSADWYQVERNNGDKVQVVPILFNYRQYGFISSYRVFAELGVGMIATTDGIPEMELDDGANFGWAGGIGLDINNNLFLHGRFIGGEHPDKDGAALLQIGYRF